MEENLKQQSTSIIKIAFSGPVSQEKTNLTKKLANHFKTVFTSAFARNFMTEFPQTEAKIYQTEDLIAMAIEQAKLENKTLNEANQYLFCDSSLLNIKIYSDQFLNFCDPQLENAVQNHQYDLFILPDFKQDNGIDVFRSALVHYNKPFVILSGNENEIFNQAIVAIENLEKTKKLKLSSHDFVQIQHHGVPLENIESQINIFKNGIPKTNLDRAARVNDGLVALSDLEWQKYIDLFEIEKSKNQLCKFVPASGAASRMFKFLLEFINDFQPEKETISAYITRKNEVELAAFLAGLEKFPFYESVITSLKNNISDFNNCSKDVQDYQFIKMLLSSDEFAFAKKPKGVLPFHNYKTRIATPIEEHLSESVLYANSNGNANLHFTISEENQNDFDAIIKKNIGVFENEFKTKININFSNQHKSTDTIAVDLQNIPIREENGDLIFRPAGHGALIQNLNEIDADIIFIKNIDNVIQNQTETIAFYKKGLAGLLIDLQQKVFDYLVKIEKDSLSEKEIVEILLFSKQHLNIEFAIDFEQLDIQNKIEYLKVALNKPIRICGMVKNEGEPGGGPFWVLDQHGNASLQIVESAQVDLQNQNQLEILKSATHFNPVDLVCSTKNFKGNKFDLNDFVDKESGFIVEKTKNGKDLKGYELPGLWNGAMAKWITLFVEVPLLTFNPVKTVNDLLKPAHQST